MGKDILSIFCPSCGAPAEFDIVRQIYRCSYCGGTVKLEDARQEKERYQRLYAQIFASNMMMTMFWWFENADTVTADEVGQIQSQNTEFGPFATFKKYL